MIELALIWLLAQPAPARQVARPTPAAPPTQTPEALRRAVAAAPDTPGRIRALEALANLYEKPPFKDPIELESVLRELIALQPDKTAPVFRLAKAQEDRGLVEAAEDTLLIARHQRPDALEPYQQLAQFYARRATAIHRAAEAEKPKPPSVPGSRDENGVYTVGGSIATPARMDRPIYPPEANAAGIQGVVIAEVVINETGEV